MTHDSLGDEMRQAFRIALADTDDGRAHIAITLNRVLGCRNNDMFDTGDGFEMLDRMKAENIDTPVVVVSNLGQKVDIDHAKELGVKEYIVKTETSLTEIVERIEKYLK